jgi:excisionase family DNA binding protein
MPEAFLTVADIADLLKLNQQTVRNWIDRGELPAVRLGSRRVRVKQSDLTRFIEAGETAAPHIESGPAREAESEPELRERLVVALDASRSALADDDDGKLIAALDAVAEAASGLARALVEAMRSRAQP